jgi:hypothetical protein
MNDLTLLFSAFAVVTLLLLWVGLRWARSAVARVVMVLLFAMLLPLAYAAPAALLGRAKPVSLEWINTQVPEAKVLSATFVEGQAIFLTLLWQEEPNLYQLAWDPRMAEQLQEAMRDADRQGTQPMMRLPFERSWDNHEPRFYALPQPKEPDKAVPNSRGMEFRRSDRPA